MGLPSPERRANPRIDINGEMTYRSGDSGESRRGEIENMSAGGALIWITEDLPIDSEILISVEEIAGDDEFLDFRAALLHRLPERKGKLYGYGCRIEVA
jgi:c-di-GMP-binding flagellar brake protein YcgR